MAKRRDAGFSLTDAIREPSFTPRERDIDALIDLLGGDADDDARKALLRVDTLAGRVLERLPLSDPRLRPRLYDLMGRFAANQEALSAELERALLDGLGEPDEAARRAAVAAIRRARLDGSEPGLLTLLGHERSPALRRAIVEALGQVGGPEAAAVLKALPAGDDVELGRLRDRALLVLGRDLTRGDASEIDTTTPVSDAMRAVLSCRPGLEELLAAELEPSLSPRATRPGAVDITFSGPLSRLFGARLWESFGFPLASVTVTGDDLAPALAQALTSPEAQRVLTSFTRGVVRYRIGWASGGKRRAVVFAAAKAVAAARPALVNDPNHATWNARVSVREQSLKVTLEPWALQDPRFAYRTATVKAASHPTIAAALVRVAGQRADDVVWDPFVGSGLELAERALAGPYQRLIGSDLDPAALEAARANLTAAGHSAELSVGDARDFAVSGITLVVSNPPLGWRVLSEAPLAPLYTAFLTHAAAVLSPGGRLVWISALPQETLAAAARVGLTLTYRQRIEMGCLHTEIQAFRK